MKDWWGLDWWDRSFDLVTNKLYSINVRGDHWNPGVKNMFRAFEECPFSEVKVAWIGQDPYPDPRCANGIAFSVPAELSGLPPTLQTIFKEYQNDLHYPEPTSGDLSPWVRRGVFLWNVNPTCLSGKSLSHDWPEYRELASEIVDRLCREGVVFVLSGAKARQFKEIINYNELIYPGENILIETIHPSPRANAFAKTEAKFIGNRLFTRINCALESLGRSPIDWRLP